MISGTHNKIVSCDSPALEELRAVTHHFLSDPAARANPGPLYRRLLTEAPVLHLGSMWLVSGFDELTWLSARPEVRSYPSVRGQILPLTLVPTLATSFALMLPMRDGTDHRRLKGLATTAFSPVRVAELNGVIEDCVDTILAGSIARGEMDVVTDLALPLPLAISAAMLDIPPGDRSIVQQWAMLVRRQFLRYDQNTDEIVCIEAQLRDFADYVRSLCEMRRRHPREDLISDLVRAADANQLSADELLAFILLLFVNGLETLTAGITMAVWEFLQHPEECLPVVHDRAYAEAVFDETVRLHSPVRFSARTVIADVTLDGHQLRNGDVVALCYGAANRDARRFSDPDHFTPRRARGRHLGFGHGAHYCLGASLSLSAGACVLARFAKLGDRVTTDISPATAVWSPALAFTTLESLPLRLASQ